MSCSLQQKLGTLPVLSEVYLNIYKRGSKTQENPIKYGNTLLLWCHLQHHRNCTHIPFTFCTLHVSSHARTRMFQKTCNRTKLNLLQRFPSVQTFRLSHSHEPSWSFSAYLLNKFSIFHSHYMLYVHAALFMQQCNRQIRTASQFLLIYATSKVYFPCGWYKHTTPHT